MFINSSPLSKPLLLALLALPILSSSCRSTSSDASFDWLTDSPYSPTFAVLDTESSLGPYANETKPITLADLVKMHGHACDGLVTAACALKVGLDELYPDGVIDRTDTGCVSNNSPCYGDVSAYLTGGRIRFGTQKIDPQMGSRFRLVRFSTGEAVEVRLGEGVFPDAVHALEAQLKSGTFTMEQLRACQTEQWRYAKGLLQHPLEESFVVQRLEGYAWEPDAYEHLGRRGDVLNKDAR